MIKYVLLVFFFLSSFSFAEDLKSPYTYGIFPSQEGEYLMANSNLLFIENDERKVRYSLGAIGATIDDDIGYYWVGVRKFSLRLKSKKGNTVEINENGFFLNNKLLCSYNEEYRSSEPLLDGRIFNKDCATKYGLISYKEEFSNLVGLRIDVNKKNYLLNGEKFFEDNSLEGYTHFKTDFRFLHGIRNDYSLLMKNLISCTIDKECSYYVKGVRNFEIRGSFLGLSPRVRRVLHKCNYSAPENGLKQKSLVNYDSFLLNTCLREAVANSLREGVIIKDSSTFFILKSQDFSLFIRKILKKNKVVQLLVKEVLLDDPVSNQAIKSGKQKRIRDLCKTEKHKKECIFWNNYLSKIDLKKLRMEKKFPMISKEEVKNLILTDK